ncbi:MAG: amidohydrolase family protein [Pseudomonadota bacterium]
MRTLVSLLILSFATVSSVAEELPIFDAHIHYSHDAVEFLPVDQAVKALRDAGVKKALVSSSDDNGTQLLFEAAPDLIVPSLRPYRRRGEIGTWMYDPTVIDYLDKNLAKNEYRAIGEFHAYGDDIETEVLQHIIAEAKERNLLLHAHSDADAIDRIFKSNPDAYVLWAHSGFDRPEEVKEMLAKHDNLWADLAFRTDQASGGKVSPDWKEVFEAFPDRVMVGTDTFAPERWFYVGPHAKFSREWLSSLPKDLAERIAYRNAEEMFAKIEAEGRS